MQLFKQFYRTVIIILCALLAAACVNNSANNAIQKQAPQVMWQEHQQQLSALTAFEATGSLAYFNDNTRYYGRFFLNQISADEYQLKLTSPVGSPIFSLSVTPNFVQLVNSRGQQYSDSNVEQLMLALTGMNIPLNSLHNWFKGLSNDPVNDQIDTQGRLVKTDLQQDQRRWRLSINKYTTVKNGRQSIELPETIELTHQGDRLRLKINRWTLNLDNKLR